MDAGGLSPRGSSRVVLCSARARPRGRRPVHREERDHLRRVGFGFGEPKPGRAGGSRARTVGRMPPAPSDLALAERSRPTSSTASPLRPHRHAVRPRPHAEPEHAGPARARRACSSTSCARSGLAGRRARRQRLRHRDAARHGRGRAGRSACSPTSTRARTRPAPASSRSCTATTTAARSRCPRGGTVLDPERMPRAADKRRPRHRHDAAATRCSAPTTRRASPRSWPRSRTSPRTRSCRGRRSASASRPTRRSARARRSSTSSASARAAPTRSTAPSVGELQDETFTAAEVTITIHGVDVHPGFATGKLVNAARLAGRDPRRAAARPSTPETTSGREGFIHVYEVDGDAPRAATIRAIVRDFDDDLLAEHVAAAAPRRPRRSWRPSRARRSRSTCGAQYPNMRTHLDAVPGGRRRGRGGDPPRGLEPRPRRRSAAAPTAPCSARWACRRRTSSPAATSTTPCASGRRVQDMAAAAAVAVRLAGCGPRARDTRDGSGWGDPVPHSDTNPPRSIGPPASH